MEISSSKHFEARGSIYTIYTAGDYDINFVQDKVSKSNQGVIRGFHGDSKTWKLITCIHGRLKLVVYDVDNRKTSSYILDGDDKISVSILVPPRFLNAHQCISRHCIMHYKWSELYTSPEDQWSVYYDDEDINPEWNVDFEKIVSDRDLAAPRFKDTYYAVQ